MKFLSLLVPLYLFVYILYQDLTFPQQGKYRRFISTTILTIQFCKAVQFLTSQLQPSSFHWDTLLTRRTERARELIPHKDVIPKVIPRKVNFTDVDSPSRFTPIFTLHENIYATRVVTLFARQLDTIPKNNLTGIALRWRQLSYPLSSLFSLVLTYLVRLRKLLSIELFHVLLGTELKARHKPNACSFESILVAVWSKLLTEKPISISDVLYK